jgi:hypothetical protein
MQAELLIGEKKLLINKNQSKQKLRKMLQVR